MTTPLPEISSAVFRAFLWLLPPLAAIGAWLARVDMTGVGLCAAGAVGWAFVVGGVAMLFIRWPKAER